MSQVLPLLFTVGGLIALLTHEQLAEHARARAHALSPVGKTFTLEGFEELSERYEEAHTDGIETFFTNGKSVAGIGNGLLAGHTLPCPDRSSQEGWANHPERAAGLVRGCERHRQRGGLSGRQRVRTGPLRQAWQLETAHGSAR